MPIDHKGLQRGTIICTVALNVVSMEIYNFLIPFTDHAMFVSSIIEHVMHSTLCALAWIFCTNDNAWQSAIKFLLSKYEYNQCSIVKESNDLKILISNCGLSDILISQNTS